MDYKNAGVDMEKKESVDKALEVFSSLVEKLEKEYKLEELF